MEEVKELKHFSHEEHPLIPIQVQKTVTCYGCQKQILELQAAYSCSPCDFFLHKRCAELPLQITHPLHSQHPLVLHKNPPYSSHSCVCNACGRKGWDFFTYNCSLCEFDLDVSCAFLDQGFKHQSHEHPLTHQPRLATFHCNACGIVSEDSSYSCSTCSFWIHKKCALLPQTAKHKDHNHSLLLSYDLPSDYRSFIQRCPACHETVSPSDWVYYCGPCRYFVHIKCVVISEDTNPPCEDLSDSISNGALEIVKLPSTRAAQEMIAQFILKGDENRSGTNTRKFRIRYKFRMLNCKNAKRYCFISKFSLILSKKKKKKEKEENMLQVAKETNAEEDVKHFCHKKPLLLINKVQTDVLAETPDGEEKLLFCDACMDPIFGSDPHYSCIDNCGFFAHVVCSKLPKFLQKDNHLKHAFKLVGRQSVTGFFRCDVCGWIGNSLHYCCTNGKGFCICIKCASASAATTIAHDAHRHVLTQTKTLNPVKCEVHKQICSACGVTSHHFPYACEDCKFYLDYECALLPPITKQRWDEHPLVLMYPPFYEHPDELYCVICEHEMNPNCWMYHCVDCESSFHPRCIPQFGGLKNMKFGQAGKVNHHPHPLVLVPEAKYKASCEGCAMNLQFTVAFECNTCGLYLCVRCACEREREGRES